ncbi:cytochrome C biogenesis protein [Halobacteria archaeon AArc-m2/3/4]|uniref:Cytochrome C biogenesis protein n=1 Tax=Natronoglomus mannanivorans TaxID=2979990 RepID=A0AAP2Z271_9EURY|nr:cytochrome C biogenesis protein [Halobacteria archaeon AArc-xg1-1]MCU4974233.1 cytochrome C biogenesis protein [Halobacteria archaeon AArc-m2/3/4]
MIDPELLASLSFAFTLGVATFFSPCAYPLLPGYVGFYVSQTEGNEATLGGAISRGLVAGVGVLVTFLVLIGVAFVVGQGPLSRIELFEPIIGGLLVVFGVLVVADRAPSLTIPLPERRSSILGFGIFGAGYALAAAGCVAPLFVLVIGHAFSYSTVPAALVLATYVGGIVLLMIALTVASGMGIVANAGRFAAYSGTLKRLAGVVMIVAGLGQLYLAIFYLEVL